MTEKTFDPTTSSYEMQVATANMQSAIIDEQNSTSQSLLQSTDAEQKNGWAELTGAMEILPEMRFKVTVLNIII